ncbi:MAG: hypothetical protein AAB351_03830 [Patescibacteria group bacterium]
MNSEVERAVRITPTLGSAPDPLPPDLTVAQIHVLPTRLAMRFRRTHFGDYETVEIVDPETLRAFVGIQFRVTNETLGADFGTPLVELLNSSNTAAVRVLIPAIAKTTGLGIEALVIALIEHNESSMVFIPKACTSSFVVTARDPKPH